MKYFLITQSACWADEFDTEGFCIKEAESKEQALSTLLNPKHEFPAERYFGTNESHIFEDQDDYFDTFEIKEISYDDYNVLKRLFGRRYGMLVTLEDY